jgi:hypothetical protein
MPIPSLDLIGGLMRRRPAEPESRPSLAALLTASSGRHWLRFYDPSRLEIAAASKVMADPARMSGRVVVADAGGPMHDTAVGALSTQELIAHIVANYWQGQGTEVSWRGTVAGWALAGPVRKSWLVFGAAPGCLLGLSCALFYWARFWTPVASPVLFLAFVTTSNIRRTDPVPVRANAGKTPSPVAAASDQTVTDEFSGTAARNEPIHQSLQLPQQIGRYRLVRVIGQGTVGTVYLERDPAIDRNVAIKVIGLASAFETDEIDSRANAVLREAEPAGP